MMKKIDLHTHTIFSDGTDSPSEIIEKAREAGLDLLSITDHDSIRAGIEIPHLMTQLQQDQGIAFIRGVEFSCKDEQGKYHILGYGYDPDTPGIAEVVAKGHEMRMQKTKARLAFLEEAFGFRFTEEEVEELLARDNPGKPHIANLMIRHGYAADKQDAISNYINKKKLKNAHVHPQEAIEGILKSGGIPVLAHPPYGDGDQLIIGEEMEQRLLRLMDFGLKGLEAFYSGFAPKVQRETLTLAERYDLYITAGSDYHGGNKMIDLGWTNLEDLSEAPPGLLRFLEDVDIF